MQKAFLVDSQTHRKVGMDFKVLQILLLKYNAVHVPKC